MMSIHSRVTPRRQIQDNYVTLSDNTALGESKLETGLTSSSQMSRHRVTGPGLLHLVLPGDTEAGTDFSGNPRLVV